MIGVRICQRRPNDNPAPVRTEQRRHHESLCGEPAGSATVCLYRSRNARNGVAYGFSQAA